MFRQPAIELTIWLNQFRTGQITKSDARNACETITENELILHGEQVLPWTELLELEIFLAPKSKPNELPFICALPIPGLTFGLSQPALAQIDPSAGVVLLSPELILASDHQANWCLMRSQNGFSTPNVRALRTELLDLVAESATELAALNLLGDREAIDEQLFKLRPVHLPPGLSTKTKQDLELAERIWLVTEYAFKSSTSVASPSNDQKRVALLTQLNRLSLEFLAAASSAE